ncbi:MAG TPA: enoyl-CoA hydratase-related protein [Stellaceae bacterium]|nr:enoyl-CoA hydratase-related protein [Stellaceae bacterium]
MTTAGEEFILTRVDQRGELGRVAYITVDNEAKRNALPTEGRAALAQAITNLSHDPELRVVVLTGAGDKSFIGGANIGEMSEFPDPVVAERGSKMTHLACDAIRRAPVPVIARINGYCLGAGMEIAAACDMRVAATTARFGMPEVKYGLPSGMEACLLPGLIGWGKARELVYTGEMIDAQEAYHFGFVERLVAYEDLDKSVENWVASILSAGPISIRIQKELIRDWERMSIADAVQQGIRAVGRAHASGEPRRFLRAYLDRRRSREE